MAEAERWGQLSYASFDDGAGVGGWQIKETTGELTSVESDLLSARVVTNFNSHETLPQFPTKKELDALPRRFTYVPNEDGTAAYWHAVQAGNDSTGRPGNVFSHILLDRDPANPTLSLRPIEMWRSPNLLVPFGADEVRQARIDSPDSPRAGSEISQDKVLSFILDDSTWRVGLLCVLMDAVSAALDGGPRVVFLAESQKSAALWFGAVSHLTSPASSRRLSWSLYERATGLDAAWSRGIHLVAVPVEDADGVVAGPRVVVISESETPLLGAFGEGPHSTRAGSTIAVTEWSEMAQMVLVDHDVALLTLQAMDEVAERVGDHDLSLAWPLAMSVMLVGADVEDAAPHARNVILSSSPLSIRNDPKLFALASTVANVAMGETAQDVWKQMQGIDRDRSPLVYELMVVPYLTRAIRDRGWLVQRGTVPMPELTATLAPADETLLAAAQDALQTAADRDDDSFDDAVYHLRLVDLLVSSHLLDDSGRPGSISAERAIELLRGAASTHLQDDVSGPNVVARVGATSTALREELLRDAINAWPGLAPGQGQPGRRCVPDVIGWLCDGRPTARLRADLARADGNSEPLELEIALWLHRRNTHTNTLWFGGQPADADGLSPLIAHGLLESYGSWEMIPKSDRPSSEDGWSVADLLAVEMAYPGALPDDFFTIALAVSAWDIALEKLCSELTARRMPSTARKFALLRTACVGSGLPAGRAPSWESDLIDFVVSLQRAAGSRVNWDEIAPLFLERQIVTAARDTRSIPANPNVMKAIIGASTANTLPDAATRLQRTIESSTGAPDELEGIAILALLTCEGFPALPTQLGTHQTPLVTRSNVALGNISYQEDGVTKRLVEAPLRYVIEHNLVSDTTELVSRVRDGIETKIRECIRDAKPADKLIAEVERFASKWWQDIGVARSAGSKQALFDRLRPGEKKGS